MSAQNLFKHYERGCSTADVIMKRRYDRVGPGKLSDDHIGACRHAHKPPALPRNLAIDGLQRNLKLFAVALNSQLHGLSGVGLQHGSKALPAWNAFGADRQHAVTRLKTCVAGRQALLNPSNNTRKTGI